MKRLVVSLFLSLFFSVQASWFGYDRGIAAARGGDCERATQLLTDELISNPEDPAVLYDSGVLAARQKNYVHAEAFFSKTVGHTAPENQLHRQALFNLGNAYVASTKLQEALKAYDQLLALDQQHEKARHNREIVKKMLEQQQSQEQNGSQQSNKDQNNSQQDAKNQNQEDKTQNNSEQSQGKQQKQNEQGHNKNNSEQQQGGQSQGGQQDTSGQQQGQQQNGGADTEQQKKESAEQSAQDTQKNSSSNGQQSDEQAGSESSDEASPDRTSPDGASRNQDHQKRDGKDSDQLDERDSYKERYGKRDDHTDGKNEQQSGSDKAKNMKSKPEDKEGGNDQRTQQHDDSPSRAYDAHKDNTTTKRMKMSGKAQESAKKKTKKQYAAWAESMLDAVQLNDEALNKVLVQKAVAGSLGGRDGECCW